MVWISFVVVLALQHLVHGRYANPPITGNNDLDGKNTTGTVQRDFEMQPAEGWRDAMLLSATPWGVGTTMYPLMPPWDVPETGVFYIRINPDKVSRLDPPVSEVDRISWVVNPPSDDLAAVSLSEYFNRGPQSWYQSIEFYQHGGVAGTKVAQAISGTVFFKDGRTAGLKGNLNGPSTLRVPPYPASPQPPAQNGTSKTPAGK
eukprot:jgi/Botrbrau1/11765/Bobra.0195s0090.1